MRPLDVSILGMVAHQIIPLFVSLYSPTVPQAPSGSLSPTYQPGSLLLFQTHVH